MISNNSPVIGAAWAYVQAWFGKGLSVAVFFVLGTLLSPKDFGIFAVISTVIVASELFIEQSVAQLVIQEKDLTQDKIAIFQNLAFLFGLGVGILLFFLADLYLIFFDNENIRFLLKTLAITPVLHGLTGVPIGLLRRNLDYRSLTNRTILGSIVGGGVAIFLAVNGFGEKSLVAQVIVYQFISVIFFVSSKSISISFKYQKVVALKFWYMVLLNSISKLSDFIETKFVELVIAGLYGLSAAGLYSFGFRVVQTIASIVALPLIDASWGSFSAARDSFRRVKNIFVSKNLVLMLVSTPSFLIVAYSAKPFLVPMLGAQWIDLPVPLAVLCLAMIFRINLYLVGVSLQVLNPSFVISSLSLVRSFFCLLFLVSLSYFGFEKIAGPCAYLASGIVFMFPSLYFLGKYNMACRQAVSHMAVRIVILVASMLVFYLIVNSVDFVIGFSGIFFAGLIGLIMYYVLSAILFRSVIVELAIEFGVFKPKNGYFGSIIGLLHFVKLKK